MITAEQIKAARALLRLEQEELARRAGVSISTVRRLEASGGAELVAPDTAGAVIRTLQEAGVEFIHQGVALKPKASDGEALLGRLRAIAERAAAQNPGKDWLTDADLYGDDGLPR
jgi:transcriptional regulator with XRE-family HTH domain